MSVERERDLALSATARQTVDDIDRALATHPARGTYGAVRHVRRPHPGRAARGDPVGRAVREVQGPWRTASLTQTEAPPPRPAAVGRASRSSRSSSLDQLTKALGRLDAGRRPDATSSATTSSSSSSRNCGSAFSRFQGYTPLLAVARDRRSSVFIVREARNATDRWMLVGLVLVLGGALGNLVRPVLPRRRGSCAATSSTSSRSARFPVFNVADSCVTIGAILLVVRTLLVAATTAAQTA